MKTSDFLTLRFLNINNNIIKMMILNYFPAKKKWRISCVFSVRNVYLAVIKTDQIKFGKPVLCWIISDFPHPTGIK